MTTDSRQKEIEKIAYSIWEREGRPDGRDFDHFTQAEQIVTKQTAPAAKPELAAAKTPRARKTVAKKPAAPRRSKKTPTS